MSIWVCRHESRNFTFEAYGTTKEEATLAFARGLRKHADQTKAGQAWVDEAVTETDAARYSVGVCYRDGERLT